MDGSVGVVEKLERGLGRDRTLAQEKREHEAGRCRADRGREQMLGITQELEVRLGLWIEADAACQGIAVEGGASAQIGRAHVNSSHSQISYAVFCLKKNNNLLCSSRQPSNGLSHHGSRLIYGKHY